MKGTAAVPVREHGAVVPYITAGSNEIPLDAPLVYTYPPDAAFRAGPSHPTGIGFADELPQDRDERGALWRRTDTPPDSGAARLKDIHPQRQRHCMLTLSCQVCSQEADRDERGVLWLLLPPESDASADWPEEIAVSHPPLCLPCAAVSVKACKALKRGHAAIRVRDPEVAGVAGLVYRPGPAGPQFVRKQEAVSYDHPLIGWTLATQQLIRLWDCTRVDLTQELVRAGVLP